MSEEDDVLFISKSIGTAVAAGFASSLNAKVRHIYFTPLARTFSFIKPDSDAIAFNGTNDTWADWKHIRELCAKTGIPLHTVRGGNHSLETGKILEDIANLHRIIKEVEVFISGKDHSIYTIPVRNQDGTFGSLREYRDKVLLIVNTATGCGFTPQYEFLEKIFRKYKKEGFEVLDFPCDQFDKQAPGTNKEIQAFCTSRYDTTFPRYGKIYVNGERAEELFEFLKSKQGFKGFGNKTKEAKYMAAKLAAEHPDYETTDDIKWNFTKFLVDRDGCVVKRYEPTDSLEELEEDIRQEVQKTK
ncbi:MAG: glutathione peroxidase [Lachnospiraceae bacterium]|nr:glutathione peroxidase [Lachnospiraceae bacterium]